MPLEEVGSLALEVSKDSILKWTKEAQPGLPWLDLGVCVSGLGEGNSLKQYSNTRLSSVPARHPPTRLSSNPQRRE